MKWVHMVWPIPYGCTWYAAYDMNYLYKWVFWVKTNTTLKQQRRLFYHNLWLMMRFKYEALFMKCPTRMIIWPFHSKWNIASGQIIYGMFSLKCTVFCITMPDMFKRLVNKIETEFLRIGFILMNTPVKRSILHKL